MNNLYERSVVAELHGRIGRLRPDSQRLWGRMNVAQALAYCAGAMENALGDTVWPRHPLGRLIGRWAIRGFLVKGRPMGKGEPTHLDHHLRQFDA